MSNSNNKLVLIDTRIMGFGNEPIRLLSACNIDTGLVLVSKQDKWSTLDARGKQKDKTVIVTDALDIIENWHLGFDAQRDLNDVINTYQLRHRANLIQIDSKLSRYNPNNVLQIKKIDKQGLQQEFDSNSLNNGHLAVLVSVWASQKIALSSGLNQSIDDGDDGFDETLVPFSI